MTIIPFRFILPRGSGARGHCARLGERGSLSGRLALSGWPGAAPDRTEQETRTGLAGSVAPEMGPASPEASPSHRLKLRHAAGRRNSEASLASSSAICPELTGRRRCRRPGSSRPMPASPLLTCTRSLIAACSRFVRDAERPDPKVHARSRWQAAPFRV
jgi:hypothetical protein